MGTVIFSASHIFLKKATQFLIFLNYVKLRTVIRAANCTEGIFIKFNHAIFDIMHMKLYQ